MSGWTGTAVLAEMRAALLRAGNRSRVGGTKSVARIAAADRWPSRPMSEEVITAIGNRFSISNLPGDRA